ncbi:MAG: TetR/AcrR family transcriptional regulator, partial [Promethearchaeota archaeon]
EKTFIEKTFMKLIMEPPKKKRARSDEKKKEIRQEILDAGMILFVTKGSMGFTMGTLAKMIEIRLPRDFSRSSLYTYFGNKYDLWVEIRKDCISRFESGVKDIYAEFKLNKGNLKKKSEKKWSNLYYEYVKYFFDFAEKEEMRYIMLYMIGPPTSDSKNQPISDLPSLDLTERASDILNKAIGEKEIDGKTADNIVYFTGSLMLGGAYLEILQRAFNQIQDSNTKKTPVTKIRQSRDYLLLKIREELQL